MKQILFIFMACLTLAGCGLGETAVSAAAGAASQADQVKEALRTEERVKQQLDAAAALEAQQRQAAFNHPQAVPGLDWDSTARSEALLGVRGQMTAYVYSSQARSGLCRLMCER